MSEFIDPLSTVKAYRRRNGIVIRIARLNGLTINEMSKELNIRRDKLLELLGYLQRDGRIRDVNFC